MLYEYKVVLFFFKLGSKQNNEHHLDVDIHGSEVPLMSRKT